MAGSVFLAKLNKFCKLALTLPIYSVIVNLAHYYTYDAPLPKIRTSDPCPFPSSRFACRRGRKATLSRVR